MAKKKIDTGLEQIFRHTEPEPTQEPNPVGVMLTAEELGQLDQIAAELAVSRHKILQYAVRDLLRRWAAGERPRTKTVTKTETKLDM